MSVLQISWSDSAGASDSASANLARSREVGLESFASSAGLVSVEEDLLDGSVLNDCVGSSALIAVGSVKCVYCRFASKLAGTELPESAQTPSKQDRKFRRRIA